MCGGLQRPFVNFYGPTFILYELSSPFLNVHWFCDKLNLTGSKIQWYNGMVLLASFFTCRLVWGTYQSVRVFQDVWVALHLDNTAAGNLDVSQMMPNLTSSTAAPLFVPRDGQLCLGQESCVAAQAEVMKFAGPGTKAVPVWLALTYLGSNMLLHSLNFYWFAKMIETVRKRFQERGTKEEASHKARRPSIVLEVAEGLERDDQWTGRYDKDEAKTSGMDRTAGARKR